MLPKDIIYMFKTPGVKSVTTVTAGTTTTYFKDLLGEIYIQEPPPRTEDKTPIAWKPSQETPLFFPTNPLGFLHAVEQLLNS